jgi:adenylate cyclase
MATECERKSLVHGIHWRALVRSSSRYAQGYIRDGDGPTVRVRTSAAQAWLTVKGPTTGITR